MEKKKSTTVEIGVTENLKKRDYLKKVLQWQNNETGANDLKNYVVSLSPQ